MAREKGTMHRIRVNESIYEFFGIDKPNAPKVIEELVTELTWLIIKSAKVREEIDKDGVVVDFEQGKQKMKIQHPAMKAYNDLVKAQTTIFKTLKDLTGTTDKSNGEDELSKHLAEKAERRKQRLNNAT